MPAPIIFYDIPSKDLVPKAWSPNTWKTRYTLNVKGIPYKTIWVEYPDIEAAMHKIGALPTSRRPDGTPLYTLPAIYDPNTETVLSESAAIARHLDKTYPDTPRLIPAGTDALHAAFHYAIHSVVDPDRRPLFVPAVPEHLLPRSQAYFHTTREVLFGGSLRDVAPPGPKREKHWVGLRKAFGTVAQWFQADGIDKPFLLGDNIGFADITLASFLVSTRIVFGENSEEWKNIMTWDNGRWARYMDAFSKYEEVDEGEEVVL
ncbi:uncharacterized protein TRAVEDRAFT_124779 [Trametes versicolor FP-101664 SS1]|uniref:uncharacterized protein n=1 Tax=Trametes versicolor (strain FP-101664) TaxID=717944 RepID=UPI0004622702|nr:uncharacterized protein TRAVEDRAFT_124779 [Trametes versicolor FP-101664 SS1]EIW58149.1 hypothetical protein TRAVEDRAFT_124779 [Trametes versicolor FP-101664 SS1]